MIGERIKKRRIECSLTQDELAKRAGISKGYLSEVENDKKNIGAEILLSIADVLDCSVDYLLRGTSNDLTSIDNEIEIPKKLSLIAKKHELSFRQVLMLLDMRKQIIAHRTSYDKDNEFDWNKFYESLKEFI